MLKAQSGKPSPRHGTAGREAGKDLTMSNQEVFDMLSELEQFLFYKSRNPEELDFFQLSLCEMHREAKTLLCQWHNLTGCINQ